MLQNKSDSISEKRKDRGKVTMDGLYRKSPTLFRTVPSLTPYGLLFPKIWGSQPPPKNTIQNFGQTVADTEIIYMEGL